MTELWTKSSYSSESANCVEVAATTDGFMVRDSKDPDGPVLKFSTQEWRYFVDGVRLGEFNQL